MNCRERFVRRRWMIPALAGCLSLVIRPLAAEADVLYDSGLAVRDASFLSWSYVSTTTGEQAQMAADFRLIGCGERSVTQATWFGGLRDFPNVSPNSAGVQVTFDLLFFEDNEGVPTGSPTDPIPGTAIAHRQVTATGVEHPAVEPETAVLYTASFAPVELDGERAYFLAIVARDAFTFDPLTGFGTLWMWGGQQGTGNGAQGGTNFSDTWLRQGRRQYLRLEGTIDSPIPPPDNDECSGAEIVTHPAGNPENDITVPIDTGCSTTGSLPESRDCTDGAGGPSPLHYDLWFAYTAPCNAILNVSMCGEDTFDPIHDAFSDGSGTCNCPTDLSTLLACDDEACTVDEQGNSVLDGSPGVFDLSVERDVCYLIRVGEWAQARGSATLTLSIACPADCNNNGVPDDEDIVQGTSSDCNGNNLPDECDPDGDGDGAIDACDNCANESNASQEDTDADGTGDACDGCPNDADKTTPGACGCGTPDVDNDSDGTHACNEECDDDPDKLVAGACGCGVPDDDTDADAVAECIDNCPGLSNPDQEDCDGDGAGDACVLADQLGTDCNANGIPDSCDISDQTSLDCNRNGLPDECEISVSSPAPGGPFFCVVDCDPDCNDNGIPDFCDIESGASDDCSMDDVPDECEPDCQPNGIADSCDIRDCPPGDPDCDDCRPNGVPDFCDIRDGFHADNNGDGIPDVCVFTTTSSSASAAGVSSATTTTGWTIGGGGGGNVAGGTDVVVNLDIPVTVASLRVLDGATLLVNGATDEDLTIATDGGILLRGSEDDPSAVSRILVANDRIIDVSGGPVRLEGGASYGPDPAASDPVSATLTADRLVALGSATGTAAGSVELIDSMSVTTGDLVLDGRDTSSCDSSSVAGMPGAPPRLQLGDSSQITVTGDFIIRESAAVEVGTVGAGGDPVIELDGDFINESVDPCLFNWNEGSLILSGDEPQTFEVGGADVGPSATGFGGEPDTNFAIRELDISAGANVTLVDRARNTTGIGDPEPDPCLEALYTNTLFLGAAATATLNNTTVYYAAIVDEGGNVSVIGCGSLLELPGCTDDTDCDDGSFCTGSSPCILLPQSTAGICEPQVAPCTIDEVCDEKAQTCRPDCLPMESVEAEQEQIAKNRYLSFVPTNDGEVSAIRVTLTDVAGFTGFNGDVRWVGPPVEHPEEGSGTMTAAQLQCEPHFMDWGDIGLLHVYGASLVPSSTYDVRVIHETCAAASSDDASYSDALTIRTAQWGDVVNPFATDGGATQPDFGDIAALVDKFTAGPTAPIKARAQLQPNVPDPSQAVNFSDIAIIVDAFTGVTYPFEGPGVCP